MGALRELNVRQNALESLPGSVGRLPALEGLFLQENKLVELPDLAGCSALRGINANQNKLRGFPAGMCKCTAMEGIYADFNEIAELPEQIGAMTGLEEVRGGACVRACARMRARGGARDG